MFFPNYNFIVISIIRVKLYKINYIKFLIIIEK